MIRATLFITALGLAGCSRSPEPPARASEDLNVSIKPASRGALPGVAPPGGAAEAFEYPADLGGEMLVEAVAPDRPALVPEPTLPTPRPRALPARLLDPDGLPKPLATLPPVTPPRSANLQPVAPREGVPVAMGRDSDEMPARPAFPIAPGITTRARDVKLPPTMPTLGRPHNERASLEDPTTDLAHAGIVTPAPKVPVSSAPFQKVMIPDPFELADQVKPKIPSTTEPGLAPVEVNPQRVK